MKIPREDFVTNSTTSAPQVNREITKSMMRENQVTRNPYQHPRHKSGDLNQSMCEHHIERKQWTYVPRIIDVSTIQSYDKNSSKYPITTRLIYNGQISTQFNNIVHHLEDPIILYHRRWKLEEF